MSEQIKLSLPYEEITSIANRTIIRSSFKRTARESYLVQLNKIEERDNFNKRVVYDDIEELAESIFANGLLEPLWLDILPDGRAILLRGHRRLRAFKLLVEQGRVDEDALVEFFPTKSDITEQGRLLDQYTSNNLQRKLKPIEQATLAFELKHNFGEEKSNQEIADLMCVSRQKVDNLILISSADDSIKSQIIAGDLNITDALNLVRNKKAIKKQADKVEENSIKAQMSSSGNQNKDMLSDEMAELEELDKQAERFTQNNGDEKEEGQPLELVGNTVANTNATKEKEEGEVKYDMDREEIKAIQNCVRNLDKLDSIVSKMDVPDQSKNDLSQLVNWLHKDISFVREWVHKNKKQNKLR